VTTADAGLPGRRRVEQIMGMPIVVDARDDDLDDELLDGRFDWFRQVDAPSAPTPKRARSAG
jgi:hypothetical protein